SRRAARLKLIVIWTFQQAVKLTAADAHVATVEDRKRKRILEQTSERRFVIVAVDADDTHQVGDHANRGLGAIYLGLNGEFVSRRGLAVDRMACAPAQIAGGFDRGLGVGERVADRLVLEDRMNAAATLSPRKMQCEVECCPHQRDAKDSNQGCGSGKARRRQRKTLAPASEQIVLRSRNVLETELRHQVGTMTDRIDRTLEDQA